MEKGLNTNPDIQLLMTQYVSLKTSFGQAEFKKIFSDIVSNDKTIPRNIGAPCAFVFTPNGKHVYCGPPRANGLQANDELKEIFVSGIQKNGSLVISAPKDEGVDEGELKLDAKKIRALLKDNDVVEAIVTISPYLKTSSNDGNSGDENAIESPIARLREMTGVEKIRSSSNNGLDSLLGRIKKAIKPDVDESELKSLGEALANAAILAPESPEKATAIYRELAESRLVQVAAFARLKLAPVGSVDELREWTSKSGTFSVEATFVSSDGKTVTLKKIDGKQIDVPIDKLSSKDVDYLNSK